MTSDKYTLRPAGLGGRKTISSSDLTGAMLGGPMPKRRRNGPRWYWSIYGLNLRGPLPEGVVVQGLADDLEAAKAAFKAELGKAVRRRFSESGKVMARKNAKPLAPSC